MQTALEPRALSAAEGHPCGLIGSCLHALGYAIEKGKDSTFEITGVSAEVDRALSERAAQVEARLAERG